MIHRTKTLSTEHDLETFTARLKQKGLPLDQWTGEKGTKTPEKLFEEIQAGETTLEITENGEIIRVVRVVAGDVYYRERETGKTYRLREDRQEWADGSVKQRPYLRGAVAEKMKAGERPQEAVLRGIKEELGLEGTFKLQEPEEIREQKETGTYPGLQSEYVIHKVPVFIDQASFNPKGYREVQKSKTTYFVWEAV